MQPNFLQEMFRTGLTTEDASNGFCVNITTDVAYDVRMILFVLTNLLVPGYFVLSLLAVLSRYNRILKKLAAHGKTSMTKEATERETSSSPSWFWVSKRCFVHFYYVGISSILFTSIWHLDLFHEKIRYHHTDRGFLGEIISSRTVAVVLLMIHVIRRAYECLYIQQYRDESSKMHIAGYALGVGHYLVLPLVFWDIDSTIIDSNSDIRGENNSLDVGIIMYLSVRGMSLIFPTIILAISTLNIWLQYEQHMHHVILADMRRVPFFEKKVDDETKAGCCNISLRQNRHYSRPPYRRWFRYVLSPHYLAEILLYLSFAIILEMTPTAVQNDFLCRNISDNNFEKLFALERIVDFLFAKRKYRHWMLFMWVATNLTISAMNNYDWYNSSYDNENTGMLRRGDNSTTPGAASHPRTASLDTRSAIFPKVL